MIIRQSINTTLHSNQCGMHSDTDPHLLYGHEERYIRSTLHWNFLHNGLNEKLLIAVYSIQLA